MIQTRTSTHTHTHDDKGNCAAIHTHTQMCLSIAHPYLDILDIAIRQHVLWVCDQDVALV